MNVGLKYFVLKPRSKDFDDPYAEASRHAMLAYANTITHHDREFAEEIRQWALTEGARALARLKETT